MRGYVIPEKRTVLRLRSAECQREGRASHSVYLRRLEARTWDPTLSAPGGTPATCCCKVMCRFARRSIFRKSRTQVTSERTVWQCKPASHISITASRSTSTPGMQLGIEHAAILGISIKQRLDPLLGRMLWPAKCDPCR